jgi:hypothetical protein
MQARDLDGREASPSAGVINSQTVRTIESGGPRGFDAGRKLLGRKHHIVVDTLGLMAGRRVQPADAVVSPKTEKRRSFQNRLGSTWPISASV